MNTPCEPTDLNFPANDNPFSPAPPPSGVATPAPYGGHNTSTRLGIPLRARWHENDGRPRMYDYPPDPRYTPYQGRTSCLLDKLTPVVIFVDHGEDVAQKVMLVMRQIQHQIYILAASGMIMNATLADTSGVSQTYEGMFELISFAASFSGTPEHEAPVTLRVHLAGLNNRVVEGELEGPLIAGGRVQVILGLNCNTTVTPQIDFPIGTSQIDGMKANLGLNCNTQSPRIPTNDPSRGGLKHDFTPHVVEAVAGENVNQKILFSQLGQHQIFILSAFGMVMNVSFCRPGTSGASQAYKGQFHIVSLAVIFGDGYGATLRLRACLLGSDGTFVSGEVDGPLIAAGPVMIILVSSSPKPQNGSLVETSISDPIWVNKDDLSSVGNPSIHEAQNSDAHLQAS